MQLAIQTPIGLPAEGTRQLVTQFGFSPTQRQLPNVPSAVFDGEGMSVVRSPQMFTIFEVAEDRFPQLQMVIAALEGLEIGLNRDEANFHLLNLEEDRSTRRTPLDKLLQTRAHEASLRFETMGEEFEAISEARSAVQFAEELYRGKHGPESSI